MEILAVVILILVHVLGAAVLIWAMLDGARSSWRDIWPHDDDGGRPRRPAPPDAPPPDPIRMPAPAFPDRYGANSPSRQPQRVGD